MHGREQVEGAVENAEVALDRPETAAQASDDQASRLRELQSACAALDEVTKPMAELLMDRAMEALLKKKGVL